MRSVHVVEITIRFLAVAGTGRAASGKVHVRSALIQMRPIAFATFAALIGTQSVLFGKTVSELIQATVSGNNQFTYWYTYISILLLVTTAVCSHASAACECKWQ